MIDKSTKTGTVVRIDFKAHGGREETYLQAVDQFNLLFSEWRFTFIEQELDTGTHEDLDRIPEDDKWDVWYQAVGRLRNES